MRSRCVLFFAVICGALHAQTSSFSSIEINANTTFYLLDRGASVEYENAFNHGFSAIIYREMSDRMKLGLGINYGTKNYYYEVEPTSNNQLLKQECFIMQRNIPILFIYDFAHLEKYRFQLINGLVVNKIIDYDVNRIYKNGTVERYRDVETNQKPGFSYNLGFGFSRQLNEKIILKTNVYMHYKLVMDFDSDRPHFTNLLEDRFSFGLGLGLEYKFNNALWNK